MQNISIFCSKSTVRPELSMVYVYKDTTQQDKLYAVATDSFRLAEVLLPDTINGIPIPQTYYTPKEWSNLCSMVNKKKPDITTIANFLKGKEATKEQYKDLNYPSYRTIIPKDDTLTSLDLSTSDIKANKDYLMDFIKLMPSESFNAISLSNIKQEKNKPTNPITYKAPDSTITLLLMPIMK